MIRNPPVAERVWTPLKRAHASFVWPQAFALILSLASLGAGVVDSSKALVSAVSSGVAGQTILVAPGAYELSEPLILTSGVTLKGVGMDKTIITHAGSWKPSTKALPTPETTLKGFDKDAYLIRLADQAKGVTISGLTLRGPQMHGAIFGVGNQDLHVHHVRVRDFLANGIRTFSLRNAKIHDCEFIDAGGRWKRGGIPGDKGGISGGAIFAIWTKDSEISHNRFIRTKVGKAHGHYGIKGRQAKRTRIHHNTIHLNFSIEFPFENDEDVEIDHNICHGAISIPKHAGGPVPESGRTFHIHHNYFTASYAIEFVRNGVEIDHNLFDFDPARDGGNLISGFGKAPAKGPAVFHNNLISNPGRGVIWINEPYHRLTIRNNHIITRATVTPRKEGLFGFNKDCDFSAFRIADNIIECRGLARPLLRRAESYAATVENNRLINVSDSARYKNPRTGNRPGLQAPLRFQCGVRGELTVDGWKTVPTNKN